MDTGRKLQEALALIQNARGHVYVIQLVGDPGLSNQELKYCAKVLRGRMLTMLNREVADLVFQEFPEQAIQGFDALMLLSSNDNPAQFARSVTQFHRSVTPKVNMKPVEPILSGTGKTIVGPGVAITHSSLQVLIERGCMINVTCRLLAVLV